MKTLFLLASVMAVFFSSGAITSQAQTLPAKVRTYLTNNYSGWKQSSVAIGCYASFKKSVVAGDFDSNGRRDYAVKFIYGRKGYILAFLEKGGDYKPYLLESYSSASEMKSEGFSIGRKGERIENEEGDVYYLKDDSPFIGPCESDAGGFLSFRKGDFKPL